MKYLIQADGKLPNLALMHLSTYFRDHGEETTLLRSEGGRPVRGRELFDPPGEAYASSIFEFSTKRRADIDQKWAPTWGGTGVRVASSLSEIDPTVDWDTLGLDYSLYPGEKRSIDFSSRGCTLRCPFCVVPKKEGDARAVKTIAQIWRGDPYPKKILLLDNDFFGQPEEEWRARVAELIAGHFKVCFSQGINIRQITDEAAAALATLEYRDNEFQERVLYTAWDNLGDEKRFKVGVEMLRRAGVPPKHLRVYMLIGYKKTETWDEILYRFNEMVALGCEPYPMAYDQTRKDLRQFQRWAIRGLYRAFPWDKYDPNIKRPKSMSLPVLP